MKNNQQEIEKIFDKNSTNIYIMCRRGVNSLKASQILIDNGYTNITNIIGGIENYAKDFDE